MIPLYAFLQGDTIGLLILADDDDTAEVLLRKLVAAARVRVEPRGPLRVFYKGRELDAEATVARARMEALDRIDAVGDVIP